MIAYEIALPDRRATRRLGRAIAANLRASDLVLLEGALGSGKTFLTRAICRALGVPPDVRITSPTFTLVHEYQGSLPICHADLYRLTAPKEVFALGLGERREGGAVLIVEWGLAHELLLGNDALVVELRTDPRIAKIRGTGTESGRRARSIAAAASGTG